MRNFILATLLLALAGCGPGQTPSVDKQPGVVVQICFKGVLYQRVWHGDIPLWLVADRGDGKGPQGCQDQTFFDSKSAHSYDL